MSFCWWFGTCFSQRTRYRRTNPHPVAWGGVGWGGIITSLAFPHEPDATLYDLQLQFQMNLMLRSMIFIGISTWSWCYALQWSSLAFPHEPDATLYDLQLQFHMILMLRSIFFNWHFHMILMLRSMIFIGISTCTWRCALWSAIAIPHDLDATLLWSSIGISTWSWCYALWSSIAIPHDLDAALYDLHWHFHMNLMLRSMIFNCNSAHPHPIAWGGVGWGGIITSLAFPHEPDATLYDLQLQFHMILMLRSMIFNWHFRMILMLRSMIFKCNSTWSWCYALWSSIAIPRDLDAALYDLHWHFHMNLMLRSMIFNCNSTHPHPIAWGGVGWGGIITSLAFPHEPDATLYDLHWHFHMNLMLRSMIFIGISTWTWCYALWSSLAFPHELDATVYDLQCEKKLRLPFLRLKWWKGCHSQSRRTFFW